jgi:hypothetical protein
MLSCSVQARSFKMPQGWESNEKRDYGTEGLNSMMSKLVEPKFLRNRWSPLLDAAALLSCCSTGAAGACAFLSAAWLALFLNAIAFTLIGTAILYREWHLRDLCRTLYKLAVTLQAATDSADQK